MLDNLFDFFNPFNIEISFLFNIRQGAFWYLTEAGPGFTDGNFHLEPFSVFIFLRPDGTHFGQSISFDHGWFLSSKTNLAIILSINRIAVN